MEELIKSLETIKDYCEKNECRTCKIKEFCDDNLSFASSPEYWEIPVK